MLGIDDGFLKQDGDREFRYNETVTTLDFVFYNELKCDLVYPVF